MAHRRLPKTCYRSPKGRAENGAPLPLNKLLLGAAYPLSTQAATCWLEGDDLAKVNAFLKETCKEVFGILPGADDGGYSLSGEAREAALSRFAFPENRKAALDVIRKLNESRDSNDNAL